MVDYTALKNQWAQLAAGTTAQKLAAINALTVAGPNVDVPVSAVVGYLGLSGKLSALIKYAAAPPATNAGLAGAELVAIIQCPNAPAFGMSNPQTAGILAAMLNALAADPASGITAADAAALLALAATTTPWWQANGYTSPFNENDLAAAGGLS